MAIQIVLETPLTGLIKPCQIVLLPAVQLNKKERKIYIIIKMEVEMLIILHFEIQIPQIPTLYVRIRRGHRLFVSLFLQ